MVRGFRLWLVLGGLRRIVRPSLLAMLSLVPPLRIVMRGMLATFGESRVM
jgi:hypothetical protein